MPFPPHPARLRPTAPRGSLWPLVAAAVLWVALCSASVHATTATRFGPAILAAGGVALSADGTTAFVIGQPPPSSSASPATSSPSGVLVPPGTVQVLSTFAFSDTDDGLSCLSSDASGALGFAASDGGDIFAFSFSPLPSSIPASYVAGTGSAGAAFIACQANPAGTLLYLLDTRGLMLNSWARATPSVAPVLIATFPNELVGSLTAVAVDSVSGIAYVGTRNTNNLYAVNVSRTGQTVTAFSAYSAQSDVTAMTLNAAGTVLYYASPAPSQGAPGVVYSLAVSAGNIPHPSSPTAVVGSPDLIWPDGLLFSNNGSLLYVKDGGALHGQGEPGEDPTAYQHIFTAALIAGTVNLSSLVTTNQYNLPPGMSVAPSQQLLYFCTTTTVNAVSLVATYIAIAASSSSSSAARTPSSSSSSSSAAASSTAVRSSSSSTSSTASAASPLSSTSALPPTSLVSSTTPAPVTSQTSSAVSATSLPTSTPSAAANSAPSATSTAAASSTPALPSTAAAASGTTVAGVASSSSSSSLSGGDIAGIAVGGAVALLLCCLVTWLVASRRDKRGRDNSDRTDASSSMELPSQRYY